MTERPPNRLIDATSPYLLQHAHNPVEWFPWGEQAFAAASERDVPIFLSVGYAACHWCHVMERESFEDEATAAFLNERFVAIKVDREERPDVDGIYMDAVQAMNRGQGGWPMSVFLMPDGRPFFAGTYFPDEPRHGMPSFRQVLEGIDDAWRERRDDVERTGGAIVSTLADVVRLEPSNEPLGPEVTAAAFASLRPSFDARWGGFGQAPKFPQPMTLEFLLRLAIREEAGAMEMLTRTLDRMTAGGMHDQIGGGFARYSVDERWHVPHFEKMLYDNAQLAQLYTRAWLVTRDVDHRRVAVGVAEYLLREMQHPEGGFFSSQDADSEGVEGRFFTWSWDELVSLVGADVASAFGATPGGNWVSEEGATNVLERPRWNEETELARQRLFEEREQRVHPATDDKILSAWNGLAIRALCEVGRVFDEPTYIEAARRCAEFVWTHLRDEKGRLLRSWRGGATSGLGFAEDHALLAGGFLTLFETTGDVTWFSRARELCDTLLARFHDAERGGFFQTADDAERLIVRPKELYDNAVPSGSSAAAEVLQRMSLYTGDATYERAALSALRLVRDAMMGAPTGFGHALSAVDLSLGPTREVAIIGALDDASTRALISEVTTERYLPNMVLAVSPPDDAEAIGAVALLAGRPQVGGVATAYVCERFVCRRPVTEPEELAAALVSP